jgi:hypothetical protein
MTEQDNNISCPAANAEGEGPTTNQTEETTLDENTTYDALTLAIAKQYGMDPSEVTPVHRQMASGSTAHVRSAARNIVQGWSREKRDAAGDLGEWMICTMKEDERFKALGMGAKLTAVFRNDEDGTLHACVSSSTEGTSTPLHVGTELERWLGTDAPDSVRNTPGRGVEKKIGRNSGAERVARPYKKRDEAATQTDTDPVLDDEPKIETPEQMRDWETLLKDRFFF